LIIITTSNNLLAIFLAILAIWAMVSIPYLIFYLNPLSSSLMAANDTGGYKKAAERLSKYPKLQKVFHMTTVTAAIALLVLLLYMTVEGL